MIPQYSTAHHVLCIISHNQANKHFHSKNMVLFINGPGKEVQWSLSLKWAQWLCFISHSFGAQSPLLNEANYDPERNDSRNILSRYRLNLRNIPTNYISNCSIHSRLTTYQVFFQLFSSKMYSEPMKWHAWLVPVQA